MRSFLSFVCFRRKIDNIIKHSGTFGDKIAQPFPEDNSYVVNVWFLPGFQIFFKCPWRLDYSRQYLFNKLEFILISLRGDSKSKYALCSNTTHRFTLNVNKF